MCRGLILGCCALLAGAFALVARQVPERARNSTQEQLQNPVKPLAASTPPAQQTIPGQPPPLAASPAPQAAAPQTLQTVVLDPAHGGPDTGARGVNGVAEKDIVLEFARETATELRAEGLQVVFTRQGDTNPSADDRATIANGQSNAIFISLHVASTGPVNTVRSYVYLFPATVTPAPSTNSQLINATVPPGFLPWGEAQKPFLVQSRKLGDLLQVEVAQKFKGSPDVSWSAPVYALRSVAEPAVAVEVSSVAANPQQLEAIATPLAQAIARAVMAYKSIYPPGGR